MTETQKAEEASAATEESVKADTPSDKMEGKTETQGPDQKPAEQTDSAKE